MKILFLTNNDVSGDVIRWLEETMNEEVIVHESLLSLEFISEVLPDFIISYCYRYIINEDIIQLFPHQIINLHISYLPWNRGAYPNFWSFIDNTPKGVTIHCIDKGIDSGDILLQKKIPIDIQKETLLSSYNLLHDRIKKLFYENWSKIKHGNIEPREQEGLGSMHTVKDFDNITHQIGPFTWDTTIIDVIKLYEKNSE